MAQFTQDNYRPRIGDEVEGMAGNRLVQGVIMQHPKRPSRPFVFCSRGGAVLCYVWDGIRKRAINEIRPVGGIRKD